jgi:hypothetical protein
MSTVRLMAANVTILAALPLAGELSAAAFYAIADERALGVGLNVNIAFIVVSSS